MTSPGGADEEIARLRAEIYRLDRQLLSLLNERAVHAVAIGRQKRALGRDVYDPAREAEIVGRAIAENRGPLDSAAVRRFFERIIDAARRIARAAPAREHADGPSVEAGDG